MKCRNWVHLALVVLVAAVSPGCNSADEETSTQVVKTVGAVESGYAFDWTKTELRGLKRIVVPSGIDVRPEGKGTEVVAYMQKTLDYQADVQQPVSIRSMRHRMGLAGRVEQDALVLATYGEWDAGGTGSATIRLVLLVPSDVEVVRREGLTGRSSPANGESAMLRAGPPGPSDQVVSKGWMPLSEMYDTERRALQ